MATSTLILASSPRFVDPATEDLRLRSDSPCIDAGDPSNERAGLDGYGNPRLLDVLLSGCWRRDMGPHEFDHMGLRGAGPAVSWLERS